MSEDPNPTTVKKIVRVIAIAVTGVFLLIVGCCSTVFSVEPGHVAVVKASGHLDPTPLQAGGPYLVLPWSSVMRMSIQTVKNEEEITVPTKGGLSVRIHAILLYKLQPAMAPAVYRDVGGKYEEVIIDPSFRNCVRDVCAEHTPEDLYTVARNDVELQILARISKEMDIRGFTCESVMLQDPQLPAVVTERIQAKIGAEQDAIRMESVYKQREQEAMAAKRVKELDAEAKVIEAKGIAEAQKIIQKDLTEEYLAYLWIEALKESAKHNNATIYVPTGGNGMPVFKAIEPKK